MRPKKIVNETIVGRLIQWREEGRVALGRVRSARSIPHPQLGMPLTHVVIEWCDGHEPTEHTWESLTKDPRVLIEPAKGNFDGSACGSDADPGL